MVYLVNDYFTDTYFNFEHKYQAVLIAQGQTGTRSR